MLNLESINLFFSRKTINKIFVDIDSGKGFEDILGNILVLPNNRIVEITNIEFEVPGINNLFTNNDQKNVYKFSCKTYDNKLVNEVQASDISAPGETTDYTQLDDYFSELTNIEIAQDIEAESTLDDTTGKVIVDNSTDGVFGRF